MGILDDAIRDHLDLKRRHGAEEPELKKLENEAFGPQGRPDASGAAGPTASAVADPRVEAPSPEITPEDLGLESLPESPAPAAETPPPDGPAPEEPPAPSPEPGVEPTSEGGTVLFHDFAAEEGLVASGQAPATREPSQPVEPADPVERALAQPTPDKPAEDAPEADAEPEADATQVQPAEEREPADQGEPAADVPSPVSEDTQVHDMAKELEPEADKSAPPADSGEQDGDAAEPALELDVEELDIELTDEEGAPGESGDSEGEGEDVLEETPEFLRDTPESDRMWFEQGKPKDFDFDEE